ncbi:type II toxin-antitoxin system VapC family toxin [Cellulomonas sp. APG4]|uniref:type II toxin-antitoxin system VapC family toxin n=1 Tax=Cellulomonas sp. APG4 TaxID=1538656 RepID=UPI00137AD890|nr:type II toxin-antitoxin system VapC family toxin [Cellulomonas sp. APG4]NCT91852.1 type II toxin-antitoxin system VapC family toxin [Cellulomonas sp. APG4]
MTRYLLDTNVISEVRRSRPHPGVARWFDHVRSRDLYLSALTVGEIRLGILRLAAREPDRAVALEEWVAQLETGYADRILDVTPPVARRWAELNRPRSLPVVDALIAATAVEHGAVLVTRNVRDFDGVAVELLNPFDAE